jgi:hypothetical protein
MKKRNDLYDEIQDYRKFLTQSKSEAKPDKTTDKVSLSPSGEISNDDAIRS